MRNRNRLLWGQQIDIVEGGLDEEQVTLFVSEFSEKAAMEGD